MKRVCLFVVAAALMLAACGGSSSSSSYGGSAGGSGSSSKGHVNITLWHGYTDVEATSIKALVKQFNATHPNIT